MSAFTWTQRDLSPLAVPVGPCAWRVGVAADHPAFVLAHPSLVVVGPDDDDTLLRRAAPHVAGLPVMLGIHEPEFSRRTESILRSRMAALGLARVAIATLHVDEEPAALKSGGALQALLELRSAGVFSHLGLAHADARWAEWMALHTPARVIVTDYGLHNQAARYRAATAATEHGMAMVAVMPPADEDALRFALGDSRRVLPVLDRPPQPHVEAMDGPGIEQAWSAYQAVHPAPAPLQRGVPQGGGGEG